MQALALLITPVDVMLMLIMCKHLAELLGADQPMFSLTLKQLERGSGNSSVDVRLTAEIIGKVHQKCKELGLDPHDTTGRELYHSLQELTKMHDRFIAERLGATDPTDTADVLSRLKALVEQLDIPKTAWVLKHSVAKRLLRQSPPKNIMKQLHYRSVDSMLKRESIGEIYGALRFAESSAWMESFLSKYKRLTSQDFEKREIQLILLNSNRWGKLSDRFTHKNHHNITHMKEMGVVLILPLPARKLPGLCITVLPQLLHNINEIRLYSSYFKLQQVLGNFGQILAEILLNDSNNHAEVSGQSVHWRVIQRHFGNHERKHHPEAFEPHLMAEDLEWRKAEEVLYRIEPALHFWRDIDYVGTDKQGKIISFNLMDNAACLINNLAYGQHSVERFQQSLNSEIIMRYVAQPSLESQILRQLDTNVEQPELLFEHQGVW